MNSVPMQQNRNGFTLVEFAVVMLIVGVVAAFGVPRFLKSVERAKASEAFLYLGAVRSAQERSLAKNGSYAGAISDLDLQFSAPRYFTVGTIAAGVSGTLENSWTLTLTRAGTSSAYGAYTVVFNQDGYDSTASTIQFATGVNPIAD